ncbi:MAG: acyl-CoA thioester hydrolase/BAAT C-terminal domain-containing protein [Pseudomonadota bacterium]
MPANFVWSEPPIIQAKNLQPLATYRLEVERALFSSDTTHQNSSLTYVADENGAINTALYPDETDESLSPYLPFQTMASVKGPTSVPKGVVQLRLLSADGVVIDERQVRTSPPQDRFYEEALGADFPGAFVLKRRDLTTALPALVILGGSEGGVTSARAQAPTFAAEGYIVLGFPYYSPAWFGDKPAIPELPRAFAELPVDYLESAVEKLRDRPDVDASSVSLLGGSKGAEYVLLAASLIPDDSAGGGFCAIVADVPTDVVWEGWGKYEAAERYSGFLWRGDALPFVPYVDIERVWNARSTGDNYTMTQAHENGRAAFPGAVESARIRVEAIDEPVMVIGGDKDTTWASGKLSRIIAARRTKAGLETETYVYPEGTHRVGGPPLARLSEANLRARLENFPAMMSFLRRHSTRPNCRT